MHLSNTGRFFFLGTTTGENQQARVFGDTQFGPQFRVAGGGGEGLQVDAQRLHEDVLDSQPGQFVGHDLAWRQDPVEIAVQLADIGFDVGSEPVAHAVAHQQRQVGVIETDDGHVELTAGIQCGPGGEVRITDLDQIRLQIAQDVAPRRQAKGETIALAERQRRGWNLVDAVVLAQMRARDQQAVANAGPIAQAPVLGIQISAHASAGGGVEHGYVRYMHDERPSGLCSPVLTFSKNRCSVGVVGRERCQWVLLGLTGPYREQARPHRDLGRAQIQCGSELARDRASPGADYYFLTPGP